MKKYEDLRYTDGFIFNKVMSTNPDIAKQVIELILDIEIRKITVIEHEKTMDIDPGAKYSRFDVYIETNAGKVIDLEMQTTLKKNLPKRMRYYQDVSDLNTLGSGKDYETLPENYVIFIVLDDPYDRNYYRYTFENRCVEDLLLSFGDGTKKIYVNAGGDFSDAPVEMKDFLRYIREEVAMSDLTKQIDDAVNKARYNNLFKVEYMSWNAALMDERREGREEGLQEGEDIGILKKSQQVYDNCIARGMSEEDALAISGLEEARKKVEESVTAGTADDE